MTQKIKIAVLGGGGRTGKYVVARLIAQGYAVKLLLRHPEQFINTDPSIEIIKGNALNADAIRSLLAGCDAVISTIGQRKDEPLVACQSTMNILNAMEAYGIERYILLAGINVDTLQDKKGLAIVAATEWMKSNFPLIQADRQKAYTVLSQSKAMWTMVRVPLIEFADATEVISVNLADCPGDKITAGDIAAFMVAQLTDDTYARQSPFIANIQPKK